MLKNVYAILYKIITNWSTILRISRDPRGSVAMDSDIRSYTIRDPRSITNNSVPPPQIPPQVVQSARPQVVQQPKPGSSSDNEKVIFC